MKLFRKYKICSHIHQNTGEPCFIIKKRYCLIFWGPNYHRVEGLSRYYRIYEDLEEALVHLDHLEKYC